MATTFIKLSLLCQYLRIFEKGSWPHRASQATIVVVTLWGLAYTILAFFPCWPVSDFWYSPADAKCWGYGAWSTDELVGTFYSHTAMNMILDIIILAIPFHLYFKTDMTFKMRMGLLALLLMGALYVAIHGYPSVKIWSLILNTESISFPYGGYRPSSSTKPAVIRHTIRLGTDRSLCCLPYSNAMLPVFVPPCPYFGLFCHHIWGLSSSHRRSVSNTSTAMQTRNRRSRRVHIAFPGRAARPS